MVDPVNPNNPVPNITQSARPSQRERDVAQGDNSPVAPVDDVSISQEAISLAEVEQLAARAGQQIANDSGRLSADIERLNALI